jgi:hypothetical protein
MRTICFILFLALVFASVGFREEARKQFFAKRHDLFEQYLTNDIHGADITLAEIESLDRRDGSIVYSTPMSMDNEMRFCRSAQG